MCYSEVSCIRCKYRRINYQSKYVACGNPIPCRSHNMWEPRDGEIKDCVNCKYAADHWGEAHCTNKNSCWDGERWESSGREW